RRRAVPAPAGDAQQAVRLDRVRPSAVRKSGGERTGGDPAPVGGAGPVQDRRRSTGVVRAADRGRAGPEAGAGRQAQVRERDRLQRVVREKIEEVGRWEVNVKTAAQRVADLERELTTAR